MAAFAQIMLVNRRAAPNSARRTRRRRPKVGGFCTSALTDRSSIELRDVVMISRIAFITAMSMAIPSAALAVTAALQQAITPAQRREAIAACGYETRLYCRSLKEADGLYAYLACLELNRARLTTRCVDLLVRYGQ